MTDIEYIEVVRGTNDPRYGLHNIGGKWFYTSDAGGLKAGLIARIYSHEAKSPGYMTASELAADCWQSAPRNANDHDSRDMQQLSGHLDYQLSQNLAYSSQLYYNSINDDRHVTYSSYSGSTLPRQRRLWNEKHLGWINTLTWQANEQIAIEGGFNYEHQNNRYRYAYAEPTNFSTPASTANDDSYTLDNFGAYVQAVIKPGRSWKIVPAIRTDTFKGHTTLNATGQTYPLQDYDWINQPKLSIVYSPSAAFSVYGNWGRTFQIVTGSRSPAYLTTGTAEIKPSINTGIELGTKFRLTKRTEARIALWQQDATAEVANLPSANATQNLGETRRKGVDFQISCRFTRQEVKYKIYDCNRMIGLIVMPFSLSSAA